MAEKVFRWIFIGSGILFVVLCIASAGLVAYALIGGALLLNLLQAATGGEPIQSIPYGWSDFVGSPVFALLASVFAVCILSGIGFFLCKICRRSKLSHIRH